MLGHMFNTTLRPYILIALQTLLVAILGTGSVIFITRALGGPSISISQITTNKESSFNVSGDSEITTVPDQAEVNLGISLTDATVKGAQDKANTVMSNIAAELA